MNRIYRNYNKFHMASNISNNIDYAGVRDYSNEFFSADLNKIVINNENFRTALWTGNNLQLTLMCINPKESIGTEIHQNVDQFFMVTSGNGMILMGNNQSMSEYKSKLDSGTVAIVPAGKWHNVINIGETPLKLFSIYAPPQHKKETIHKRKVE